MGRADDQRHRSIPKEQNPDIRIIGVDPVGSLLLETWQNGHVPDEVQAKTYKVEASVKTFCLQRWT